MNKAQEGDRVTITYQGVLDDGMIFDESDDSAPLIFILGLGMEVGDRKTVTIPPEHGYGVRQQKFVEEVSIDPLPPDLQLDLGGQLEVTAADGTAHQLVVVELGEQKVTLDGNHPLAGKSLILQIELVSIDRPTIN
jgi:peptidylprolyl isomerase